MNIQKSISSNKIGTVYWITGLAGAGKTTIAKLLVEHFRKNNGPCLHLDGDCLREVFGHTFSNTREDRLKLALIYSKLCQMIASQGVDVVCSTISLFKSIHEWNSENLESYIEIFVNVSGETLKKRNQKGLYTNDTTDNHCNVVGIDIKPEFPQNPHITLNNDEKNIEETLKILVNKITELKCNRTSKVRDENSTKSSLETSYV